MHALRLRSAMRALGSRASATRPRAAASAVAGRCGARLNTSPSAGQPGRRGVHVQVARTETPELLTVTEVATPPEQQPAAVYATATSSSASSASSSSSATAASAPRLLPSNYAPETRFTVDNVAAADVQRFAIHPSVPYWASLETTFGSFYQVSDGNGSLRPAELEDLPGVVGSLLGGASDTQSAAYWAYHLARTAFFLGMAATGAITHHLAYNAQHLLQGLGLTGSSSSSSTSPAAAAKRSTPLEKLSANARAELTNRLTEALAVYRRDLQYIQEGAYKLPWDMTDLQHRQYNPVYIARMSAAFFAEAVSTLNRRLEQAPTNNWFSSNLYPLYYEAETKHYQTDGWLSSASANVYELSTETLFFGRQDAMQRTSLLALAAFIRASGRDPASLTVAEVGCGTGRFHTFIKDNWPTLRTVAADLSPFYLAKARENVSYWKQQRAAQLDLGGTDGTGVTYVQAAMETLPLPDASLDAVVCIYCFHEMPEDARSAAAAEWFRVLKPGGLVVLSDSVQLGDRPAWDRTLGQFGNMNEPHYRNYIASDLGSLFDAAGFACGTKWLSSATKTLSFTKPLQADSSGSSSRGPELN